LSPAAIQEKRKELKMTEDISAASPAENAPEATTGALQTPAKRRAKHRREADPSKTVGYEHRKDSKALKEVDGWQTLKMPTAGQLLEAKFEERKYLLRPWLREHEACMVYAATGVGKSLFALSVSMAIAGNAEHLGWHPDEAPNGGWRVLYVDGEMHIGDIQDRLRRLRDGMEGIDKAALDRNLEFVARTHQDPGTQFPSITEDAGQSWVLYRLARDKFDVVVLDNFSTLGEVEDENAASSFNAIQEFLLRLKTAQVTTILVHHAGKAGDSFRGSSKLAATFDSIIQLERPEAAHRDIGGRGGYSA
jgi:predicted ATP-dependent serine protease